MRHLFKHETDEFVSDLGGLEGELASVGAGLGQGPVQKLVLGADGHALYGEEPFKQSHDYIWSY